MNCWYKTLDKVGYGLFQCWSQWSDGNEAGSMALIVDKMDQSVIEVAAENVSFATIPPWSTEFVVKKTYICRDTRTGGLVLTFNPISTDEILGSNILIEGVHV